MEQPCWALGCHRSVPPFPHILSLDAKSLLTRAPGTHQTSSPTSLRHGQTHRLQERFYGGGSIEVESCFLSLLLSPVSTSAWSSLVYLAPPGNRLPSWGLSSACPSHSLPTCFWLCATCTISLSSFVPLFVLSFHPFSFRELFWCNNSRTVCLWKERMNMVAFCDPPDLYKSHPELHSVCNPASSRSSKMLLKCSGVHTSAFITSGKAMVAINL